jgi:ribosome maturation factor RimP
MANPTLSERLREIAASTAEDLGLELVHVEVTGPKHNPILTVFADKPGGITVDDCSVLSRATEARVDADEMFPDAYTLEVSSPGIERGLYSIADFRKFAGSEVRIRMERPVDGQRNFTGPIADVEDGFVVIDDAASGRIKLEQALIKKANLKVDLDKEFREHASE